VSKALAKNLKVQFFGTEEDVAAIKRMQAACWRGPRQTKGCGMPF